MSGIVGPFNGAGKSVQGRQGPAVDPLKRGGGAVDGGVFLHSVPLSLTLSLSLSLFLRCSSCCVFCCFVGK